MDASNYRPVSLTSIICKIMESLVRDGLMDYMENEGLITEDQHGFVCRKACVTNLIEMLDLVTSALVLGKLM